MRQALRVCCGLDSQPCMIHQYCGLRLTSGVERLAIRVSIWIRALNMCSTATNTIEMMLEYVAVEIPLPIVTQNNAYRFEACKRRGNEALDESAEIANLKLSTLGSTSRVEGIYAPG
jgi:hypothetical protein